MNKQYSVLMSVYGGERSEYLHAALMSIVNQTLAPDEIILVCDGPLTEQLEVTIKCFEGYLTLVRLTENRGLGNALAEGIIHCRNEWIARMDSDDIAVRDRCERQLLYIEKYSAIDVLSGALSEFSGDALTVEEAAQHILSHKRLPVTHQDIGEYIKFRNPINHPCAMFRKSKVLEAGNYQPCMLFEDYDLWVRMYQKHCIFANLDVPILYMRVNNMHRRRGGLRYGKAIACFWTRMYQRGMISFSQYLITMISRMVVSLMPNQIRKLIYDKKLRNH